MTTSHTMHRNVDSILSVPRRLRILSPWLSLPVLLATVALPGCGVDLSQLGSQLSAIGGGTNASGGGTTPVTGGTTPTVKTSVEPNDSFATATSARVESSTGARQLRLEGTISSSRDFDIFDLGELVPGDSIEVDATAQVNGLDISVTLFDGQRLLVFANDDRAAFGSRFLDSRFQVVVRHRGDPYYLVIATSSLADTGFLTGDYSVTVTISPNASVPASKPQILVLDFDGGTVSAPSLPVRDVVPFDASQISNVYAGQEQIIEDSILATFRQNYRRFNVQVLMSDDPAVPTDCVVSHIYFGGYSPTTFGIAENVDAYNIDVCDDAVIFTETFVPSFFSVTPTAEELGVAIGNVGSHEAGHLLGLNHVDDDRALMDDQSAADAFLLDQEFMKARMSADIIPLGYQDSVLLLDEIVGPAETPAADTSNAKVAATLPMASLLSDSQRGGTWMRRVTTKQWLNEHRQ